MAKSKKPQFDSFTDNLIPLPIKDQNPPLRIYGIPKEDFEALQNIASNSDLSLADFMRPHLRKIAEQYPELLRNNKSADKRGSELKMYGIPKPVITWLENISSHAIMDFSNFMKPKLKEIIDSYPPKMRKQKAKRNKSKIKK